jgi:hypothetical protein
MRRPFTKNTGNYIKGTFQIGDLSIGVSPFSQSYEGLTWWEGPEENSVCIIAKDTTSKGSPVGDTGTVRFWGTGSTDEAFIGAVNNVSGQNFTTTSSCNSWLSSNGYWTNCGVSFNPETYPTHSTINVYQISGGNIVSSELYYSTTEDKVYVNTLYKNSTTPRGNAIVDASTLSSGGTYNVTTYLPTSGSSSFPANSGTGVVDQTNNKYYNYDNTSGEGHITGYDLSNNTISEYITYTLGDQNVRRNLTYDSETEKLVGWGNNELFRIFNTNPLSFSASLDPGIAGGDYPTLNGLISNNKGQVFVQREGRYWVIDINSKTIIKNASYGSGLQRSNRTFGAYCPTTDKFYVNTDGTNLTIIDGSSFDVITNLTLTTNNSYFIFKGVCVTYDSKRDTIWTFDAEGKLCAIDVENDTVFKRSSFSFGENYVERYGDKGGLVAGGDLLFMSSGNPNDIDPLLAFDLNKIWPT